MQENAHVHADIRRDEITQRQGAIPGDPSRVKRQRTGQKQTFKKRRGIRHGADQRPFARVRSGAPTGTTPHFKAWMADLDAGRQLYAIKLDHLADTLNIAVAGIFATLFVKGKVRNVLQLSKMNIETLLPIVSGDLDGLAAVESYLNSKRVRLAWTTA